MKFAAAYENGMVCQDFHETKQFKLYTVENDRIVHMEVVDAEGNSVSFLKAQGAGILVCGKLDSTAKMKLMSAGIAPFPGAYGNADMQVGALFAGMLASEPKHTSCGDSCETCAHREQCGVL